MPYTIREGSKAPDFSARDVDGKSVRFSRPHATPYVLIVFLRYAGCPLCNLALHRLSLEYPLLRKNGCEVLVVIESTTERIQKNIYARHKVTPPFHIFPDPKRKLYALYGVTPRLGKGVMHIIKNLPFWVQSVSEGYGQREVDGSLFIVPALFLVDKKGKVRVANYAANFYDDATFTPIYETVTFDV